MEIASKITGGTLDASEFNQIPDELENLISSTGQAPAAGDLFQVSKGIADYAGTGDFYTDSGAADAYVLSATGSKQSPTAYADGMKVRFVAGNTNTGASTINVATLGVKGIKDINGNTLASEAMISGELIEMKYDNASGNFFITNAAAIGSSIQILNTQTGAVNTGTTILPYDDTIPQNTEGDEYMTLAITPKSSANKIMIEVVWNGTHSVASTEIQLALFQDSTAGALASSFSGRNSSANSQVQCGLRHFMTAGTTSATTFKIRAGSDSAGTTTFNGSAGLRIHGGVLASSITITEIKV